MMRSRQDATLFGENLDARDAGCLRWIQLGAAGDPVAEHFISGVGFAQLLATTVGDDHERLFEQDTALWLEQIDATTKFFLR